MALFNITDRDNGIKVGDLITTYHAGYWIVTSIDQRVVTKEEEKRYHGGTGKEGDLQNSIINYELAFTSNFKPVVGKNKKTKPL
jgi:ribosomal protein L21E